jgi:hypothetical protein
MYSILKPNYVYRDTSEDIADHDDDYDAEEWHYNGRDVYRGALDRSFDWNVYSLYDDNSKRVGLAEHHPDHPEIFFTLWFDSNPFSTLFQEKWVCKDATLWSILSNEAYQDCLETDFKNVFDKILNTNIRLMTPDMIINMPEIHECLKCGKKSLLSLSGCPEIKRPYIDSDCSVLFIDESFVMYTAPPDSRVWSKVHPRQQACGGNELQLQKPEQGQELQQTQTEPDRHNLPPHRSELAPEQEPETPHPPPQ